MSKQNRGVWPIMKLNLHSKFYMKTARLFIASHIMGYFLALVDIQNTCTYPSFLPINPICILRVISKPSFIVLLFGLSMAPHIVTKMLALVITLPRAQGIYFVGYLGNLLVKDQFFLSLSAMALCILPVFHTV